MKYKVKQSGRTQKIIEMHISGDLVKNELDRIYKEISKSANVPGYRIGKAPIDIIKKRYQKESTDEAIKSLLADSLSKAVDESKLDILGYPEIGDLDFSQENGMSYKATVNMRPQPKIKAYKGLELKSEEKKVSESDVDARINSFREMGAKYATKDKEASKGDYVICDLDCIIDNKSVEKKENAWLHVSDDSFIPGSALEGAKAGQEKTVEKVLPREYSKKELAGKNARFFIKIKEVKEKILPEINDEFIAALGDFKNLEELKEAIRVNIKRMNDNEARRDLEHQVISILDKQAVFDVPQFLVDKHLEALVKDSKERMKRQGREDGDLESIDKDLRARLAEEARRQVRTYFMLDKIGKEENIEVTEEEIEDYYNAMASSSNHSVQEVKKHYEDNKLLDDARQDIRQRKVLDFIIENAKIN